jgi:REP element-mobilizing transposase RayT
MYRRNLPHVRAEHATYFVTWRLFTTQPDLTPAERSLVAGVLRHFDGQRFALHSFVVMNNHVHLLVRPFEGHELQTIVHSWKSFSAHRLQTTGRKGRIWLDEYFDRVVRDADELDEKARYIAGNPWKRWPELAGYEWLWQAGTEAGHHWTE